MQVTRKAAPPLGIAALATLTLALASPAHAGGPSYTYVGSYNIGDGQLWSTRPATYTAREAAALIYGGVFTNYAISTSGADPSKINFMAFLDGYGNGQYLSKPVSEDFKSHTTYDGYGAYSAYVADHTQNKYYGGYSAVHNYVFRETPATPAPEPSSVAAFAFTGLGAVGLIFKARKRKASAA